MCEGGRLVADFVAGTSEKPDVPELAASLTATVDGAWVVWAYKLAWEAGDHFIPCTGIGTYPAEAQAECAAADGRAMRAMRAACLAARGAPVPAAPHAAPDRSCTCGFYALSDAWAVLERRLSVARPGLPARSPRRPGRRWAVPPRDASPGERFVDLTVILSGRVLAFEWPEGGFLFGPAARPLCGWTVGQISTSLIDVKTWVAT